MQNRVFNFSAGPANLPLPVLEEAQRDLPSFPDAGMSVMEMSHRSKWFEQIINEAETNVAKLLHLPSHYKVLFLHGGARLQFSMIPINFLKNSNQSADYIVTGAWGSYALKEAQKEAAIRLAWSGKDQNYSRVPSQEELQLDPNSAYVHFTSNETIEGVAFKKEPDSGNVPLICDASSDFLSRPIPVDQYGLIYAGAQKNVGPSGVAVVILREDMLQRIHSDNLHSMLDYRIHVKNKSMYNTPPTFTIYIIMLVTRWLLNEIGGIDKMAQLNEKKAALLYDVIDQSNGFYKGHAEKESRSLMNVTWRFANEELQQKFLDEAKKHHLYELKGHRSVGGIRASIYNAMPIKGVEALKEFMLDFMERNRT
ncbi:MAG: 3-phosphoserine/phosphohydroxythreonine transaminase [Chlamydiota bacterium]|nr:3-phosphoserine/phosphohydroxythreonine transaminase [Chlamydiota bacterium]